MFSDPKYSFSVSQKNFCDGPNLKLIFFTKFNLQMTQMTQMTERQEASQTIDRMVYLQLQSTLHWH